MAKEKKAKAPRAPKGERGSIDLAAVRQRGAEAFSGFTAGQRTMLGLAVLGMVVGVMFFLRWSSATDWAPLYTNLPSESAAEVTAALDARGTPYELADGGGTIMVPKAEVYPARIDLSGQGLPRDGSPGYDLLDQQGLTTSEFRQRVDYQRALEGELSSTIEAIDGVNTAIVHLVIPEQDLFSGDSQHPSASVLIETRNGESLAAGQVQAVVHLVASSVEGLEADQVTVADSTGKVLSTPGDDGMLAAAGDARASQTALYESAMADRLEAMIAAVTGPDRARVTVTAQLDFDREQTTTESFSNQPDGTQIVAAESTDTEVFTGTGGNQVGGVLGPDATPIATGSGDSNYNRTTADRTFAPNKTTQTVESAPGAVERLSIAVLLDEAAGADAVAIRQLVSAGAGLDPARGDTIEVSQLPFDTTVAEEAQAQIEAARATEERTQLFSLLRTVASVLIVGVVLFFAWRSTRKAATKRFPVAIPLDVADPDSRGLPAGDPVPAKGRRKDKGTDLPPAKAVGDGPEIDLAELDLALEAAAGTPDPEDVQREERADQISDLIDRQPDDVAVVLRSWMAEKR